MNERARDVEHCEQEQPRRGEYDEQDQPGIHCQPLSHSLQSLTTWGARFLSGRQLRLRIAKLYLFYEPTEPETTMSHHTPQVQRQTEQYRSPPPPAEIARAARKPIERPSPAEFPVLWPRVRQQRNPGEPRPAGSAS
jgi:hypothetical protein